MTLLYKIADPVGMLLDSAKDATQRERLARTDRDRRWQMSRRAAFHEAAQIVDAAERFDVLGRPVEMRPISVLENAREED